MAVDDLPTAAVASLAAVVPGMGHRPLSVMYNRVVPLRVLPSAERKRQREVQTAKDSEAEPKKKQPKLPTPPATAGAKGILGFTQKGPAAGPARKRKLVTKTVINDDGEFIQEDHWTDDDEAEEVCTGGRAPAPDVSEVSTVLVLLSLRSGTQLVLFQATRGGGGFGVGTLAFQFGRQISHTKSRGFLLRPPTPFVMCMLHASFFVPCFRLIYHRQIDQVHQIPPPVLQTPRRDSTRASAITVPARPERMCDGDASRLDGSIPQKRRRCVKRLLCLLRFT